MNDPLQVGIVVAAARAAVPPQEYVVNMACPPGRGPLRARRGGRWHETSPRQRSHYSRTGHTG